MRIPKQLEPEDYLPYENKWIAIDESSDREVIAGSGNTLREAKEEAARAGCPEPVMMYVKPFVGAHVTTPFVRRPTRR